MSSGRQRKDHQNNKTVIFALRILLAAVGVFLIAFFFYTRSNVSKESNPALQKKPQHSPPAQVFQNEPDLFYPTDKLFITRQRDEYQDGEMTLNIPRLNYTGPILNGVSNQQLDKGVGLYDYATTPGWAPADAIDNFNLSVAAHRDLWGMEFYYIDTITVGDKMYVTYNGMRYTFTYLDTTIIEPDDWSVIYCIDQPILTLTSCDPIAVANKRIIVRAVLSDVEPL